MNMEKQVMAHLEQNGGRMEQDQLIHSLQEDGSEGEVLNAVRDLMEQGHVSYTLDWELMVDNSEY